MAENLLSGQVAPTMPIVGGEQQGHSVLIVGAIMVLMVWGVIAPRRGRFFANTTTRLYIGVAQLTCSPEFPPADS